MKYKTIQIIRLIYKIITYPLAFLYFGGFISAWSFNKIIDKLHEKAIEEGRTDIWFSVRCIRTYLSVVFLSLFNIYMILLTFYLISK